MDLSDKVKEMTREDLERTTIKYFDMLNEKRKEYLLRIVEVVNRGKDSQFPKGDFTQIWENLYLTKKIEMQLYGVWKPEYDFEFEKAKNGISPESYEEVASKSFDALMNSDLGKSIVDTSIEMGKEKGGAISKISKDN